MKQLRLMWPIIRNPGMKTTKVEVSNGTSRESNELAAGCLPDQRRVPTSEQHGGAGKDRAHRDSSALEPDPTPSCLSQAPGFPRAN